LTLFVYLPCESHGDASFWDPTGRWLFIRLYYPLVEFVPLDSQNLRIQFFDPI
jgi:hypothetical protein